MIEKAVTGYQIKTPKILKLFRSLILTSTFKLAFSIYLISVTITVKGVVPIFVDLCVTASDQPT